MSPRPDSPHVPAVGSPVGPVVPRCARCGRLHRTDLRCWSGRYAQRMVRHILQTQGRICWRCQQPARSADHIVPRSHGGGDEDANLRPSCSPCNSSRGARLPFQPETHRPGMVAISDRWRS